MKPSLNTRISRFALVAGATGIAGLFALLSLSLYNEYQASVERAQVEAENLSRVLEENTLATIRNVDLVLRDVLGQVRPEDMRIPLRSDTPRTRELHRMLQQRFAGIPEFGGLNLIDAQGQYHYSAYDTLPNINVADRHYFQHLRDTPRAGLEISEALMSRSIGKWALVVARRLQNEDGSFAGLAHAVLGLDYFQHFYSALNVGPNGTLVLRDKDLRLLARFPAGEPFMGKQIPGHHAAEYVAKNIKHGVYHARGQVDGIARLYSFRKVGDLPLYVFAGIAEEDYLADWRQHMRYLGAAALVISLVVLGLVLLSRRGLVEQERTLTELVRSEAQLRESQRLAHLGSWELDLVDNKLAWSDEIFSMFEIDPARFGASYDAFLNTIHPDDRDRVNKAYSDSLASHSPYDIVHRLLMPDGRVKFVHERCETFYGPAGKPLRSVGTVQDITETKRAEVALRESEDRFRTMADYTYDWEYWQGPNQEMWYVTPSCERVTGYSQEEFIADPGLVYSIIHPDDRHLMDEHVHDSTYQDSATVDFRIVRKDGEIRWLAHACRAVHWHDEKFMGRRASNRDITDRKRLEMELGELNRNLELRVEEEVAKNREKDHILIQQSRLAAMGEMIHNIAHQWRQPLNALSVLLANIKDDYDYHELTAESLEEATTRARKLLQRMSTTIDDFRDFFRPDHEPGEFELGQSVEDALFVIEASLANNNIRVERNIAQKIVVYGFSNQFVQVLLNLLSNAKEALSQGHKPDALIRIGATQSGEEAVITIEDNGGGIAADILPKIFEPYFTTKEQGSGIGLYMSKMIIERNFNGKIEAVNAGQGALITITLPLRKAETSP
ncbi:MAG: PAS domain-containing protein [Sulfuricella sp.]